MCDATGQARRNGGVGETQHTNWRPRRWRLGTVDDIANSVRFLLGDESSWITGQCVSTDAATTRAAAQISPH